VIISYLRSLRPLSLPSTSSPSQRSHLSPRLDRNFQRLLTQVDETEKLEAKLNLPGQYVLVEGKPSIREGVEPGIVTLSSVVFSGRWETCDGVGGKFLWQFVRNGIDVETRQDCSGMVCYARAGLRFCLMNTK
jgi:hypothetical protein